jgi:hypothetical protein
MALPGTRHLSTEDQLSGSLSMATKVKNLGGRAYLISQLRKRGMSRRGALRVLNGIFAAMKGELARGRQPRPGGSSVRRRGHWEQRNLV